MSSVVNCLDGMIEYLSEPRMETLLSIIYKSGNSLLDRGPRTLELGNGAPGRMFDASLERLSVTETSYNNSLAERAPRSTIQTLPATLPEPTSKARGPRSVIKKPQGPSAAIGDG